MCYDTFILNLKSQLESKSILKEQKNNKKLWSFDKKYFLGYSIYLIT